MFFFSDLFSKSPLVKYQPKISPTWSFPPSSDCLNDSDYAVFGQSGPIGLGSAVKHARASSCLQNVPFMVLFAAAVLKAIVNSPQGIKTAPLL